MRSAGKTAAFIYVLAREEREEGRTGPGGKQWGRGEGGGCEKSSGAAGIDSLRGSQDRASGVQNATF